jgi:lipopolysaccharide biosynthesis glycosyltransferase
MQDVPVIFCADRRVLPGLHVAAASVLMHRGPSGGITAFNVISDDLTETDLDLLDGTLRGLGRPFRLRRLRVDPSLFRGFPSMRGSWGNYFRLFACSLLDCERSVYLDVDTICLLDVEEVISSNLTGCPAGFVAEGSVATTADASIRSLITEGQHRPYLNSGVMVVEHASWRRQRVTERCIELLESARVDRHEQTALNVVLADNWALLDGRYNFPTNCRAHWPALAAPGGAHGRILHFLDNPKPWDLMSEVLHPHYRIWREILDQTALRSFRSWHNTPSRRPLRSVRAWRGYLQAAKDRALFTALSRGWISRVKGMEPQIAV